MSTRIKGQARIAFPVLFTPEPFEPGSEPRWCADFLIPKGSDLEKAIEKAVKDEAAATWGKGWEKALEGMRNNNNKCAWRDGDLSKYESNEGHMIISTKRRLKDGPPAVINRDRSALAEKDGVIYAGAVVNFNIDVWAQKGQYQGIRATLNGVQFVKDGDSFGGAARIAADNFDDLGVDTEEADDLA